jgi:hypothetical protein
MPVGRLFDPARTLDFLAGDADGKSSGADNVRHRTPHHAAAVGLALPGLANVTRHGPANFDTQFAGSRAQRKLDRRVAQDSAQAFLHVISCDWAGFRTANKASLPAICNGCSPRRE